MLTNYLRMMLLVGVLLVLGCSNPSSPDPPSEPTADEKENLIAFSDGEFTIAGVSHKIPFLLADLIKTIGPPDRTTHLENVLSTWDKLGIVIFEYDVGEPVDSISVFFRHHDFDFSPEQPFPGTLRFNGVDLHRNSTIADLEAAGLEQDDEIPSLFTLSDQNFTTMVEFNKHLIEFSITPKKAKPKHKVVTFPNGPIQFEIPQKFDVAVEPNDTLVISPGSESGIILKFNLYTLPKSVAEEFVREQAREKGLELNVIDNKTTISEYATSKIGGFEYELTSWQVGFDDKLIVMSAEVEAEKKNADVVDECFELIPMLIRSIREH